MDIRKLGFVILVSTSSVVFAGDPCATELCLSSKADADKTMMCKPPVNAFFAIKKKTAGAFDPWKTLKARRSYIYKCQSGNKKEKEFILATYGMIVKP
jgi:hypothetical protein